MKIKNIFFLLIFSLLITFLSCGERVTKKEETNIKLKNNSVSSNTHIEENTNEELITLGEKLFADKTCTTCHFKDKKVIGPSILDINKIYAEKNADLFEFLKGNLEPIVDKDPIQVSIMKANLDGFVKDLTDKELNALKIYMLSVK